MASTTKNRISTTVARALIASAPADRKLDAIRVTWPHIDDVMATLKQTPATITSLPAELASALLDNDIVDGDVAAAAYTDKRTTVQRASIAHAERRGVTFDQPPEKTFQPTPQHYDAIIDRPFTASGFDCHLTAIGANLYKNGLNIDGYAAHRIIERIASGDIAFDPERELDEMPLFDLFSHFMVTSDAIDVLIENPATRSLIITYADEGHIPIRDMYTHDLYVSPGHLAAVTDNNSRSDYDVRYDIELALDIFEHRDDVRIDAFNPRWGRLGLPLETRRRMLCMFSSYAVARAAQVTPEFLREAIDIASVVIVADGAPDDYFCINVIGDGNDDVGVQLITAVLRGHADTAARAARGQMSSTWIGVLTNELWGGGHSVEQIGTILNLMTSGGGMTLTDAEDVAARLG